MGMTEDFEASLQVLRGFDTDISIEVNEIKVIATSLQIKLVL
jgi:SP family sugar porter-like MFS transporter